MIPYLVLIFLPLVFLFVLMTNQKGRRVIVIGTDREIQNHSLLIPAFFVIFFVLLILRHENIGADVLNYKSHFLSVLSLNIKQVLNRDGDVLYNVLTWVFSRFCPNFRLFLAIIAAIILLPIAALYAEDREHAFIKMILFINMPVFIMIFSGLRQAIAFSVGVIAYKYVRERRLWWFLIWALIAMGFHHSGFIVLTFYPIYYANFKKKHLWIIVPVIILLYIFNEQIFGTAVVLLTLVFGEDYSVQITDTGAYTMLILFALFAVASYVLPDENLMDEETMGLRNFLLVAVVMQGFVPLHQLAMRMNYYFILFIPVLIPKIIKSCKSSMCQVGYVSNWAISLYFLVYYLDKLYTSCATGISTLGTYPYRFFWQ